MMTGRMRALLAATALLLALPQPAAPATCASGTHGVFRSPCGRPSCGGCTPVPSTGMYANTSAVLFSLGSVPSGLAQDGEGRMYVASKNAHSVRRYEGATFATHRVVAGSEWARGSTLARLYYPYGISVDPTTRVLTVADTENHRTVRCTPTSSKTWLTACVVVAGGNGRGNALKQLAYPHDAMVDAAGALWVVNTGANVISKWAKGASAGTVVFGSVGVGSSRLSELDYAYTLAMNAGGDLFVADGGSNYRILKVPKGASTGSVAMSGFKSTLTGVLVGCDGAVYAPSYEGGSVQRQLGAPSAASPLTRAAGNLVKVWAITTDWSGNLYSAHNDGSIRLTKPGGTTAGMLNPVPVSCKACVSGRFSASANRAACTRHTLCPAGMHTQAVGTATADDATCVACAAGKHKALASASSAKVDSCTENAKCAAGFYTSLGATPSRNASCVACAAAKVKAIATADPTKADACSNYTVCARGKYTNRSAAAHVDAVCETCAFGMYQPAAAKDPAKVSSCIPQTRCSSGNFTKTLGSVFADDVVCEACSSGKFKAAASASAAETDACAAHTNCAKGRFTARAAAANATTDALCIWCGVGHFKDFVSPDPTKTDSCTSHTACAAGKYTRVLGTASANTVCETCASGKFTVATFIVTMLGRSPAVIGDNCTAQQTITRLNKLGHASYQGTIDDSPSASYKGDSDCTWTMKGAPGTTMRITFTEFFTERGYDYVYVLDGETRLAKLDGAEGVGRTFNSTGDVMKVRLTTDSGTHRAGFKLKFTNIKTSTDTCTVYTRCPRGRHTTFGARPTADAVCTACRTGRFKKLVSVDATKLDFCKPYVPCAPGQFRSAETGCAPCAEGKFKSPTSNAWDAQCINHTLCGAGRHVLVSANATSNPTCTDCPAGRAKPKASANGTISRLGDLAYCAACPAGNWSGAGSAACKDFRICPVGEYTKRAGVAAADALCAPCPLGTFKLFASTIEEPDKADACVPATRCAKGNYSVLVGVATRDTRCARCAPGRFKAQPTAKPLELDTCDLCPLGKYQPRGASTDCIRCPAGKYSATLGAVDDINCEDCPAGTFSDPTGSRCNKCGPSLATRSGQWPDGYPGGWSGVGADSCTPCSVDEGTATFQVGSSSADDCVDCPFGENWGTFENVQPFEECHYTGLLMFLFWGGLFLIGVSAISGGVRNKVKDLLLPRIKRAIRGP